MAGENDLRPSLVRPSHKTLTESTAEAIRDAIQQGQFPIGSQLPTETELVKMLSVSRTTLREALRILEEQGLIVRKRGLGRYISQRSIIKDLSKNFGITEMIMQAGFTPGTLHCAAYEEPASAQVAEALQIEEGAPVFVLDRVRTANGQPVVWSKDILIAGLFGGEHPDVDEFEHQSLYSYLQKQFNMRVVHGTANIIPVNATAETAAKLDARKGAALLLITQTDYADNGSPVVYSIEYHVPDKFVFVIYRKGPDL